MPSEQPPALTPTTGPTEHLDTVEYWRDLYRDAVAEGQRQIGHRDWLAIELAALCGGTAAMWKDRAEQDWPHPPEHS